jgi:hypothetical protein
MVGKPNLVSAGPSVRADTPDRARLERALDRERTASMADEGGASGAVMDTADQDLARDGQRTARRASWVLPSLALAAAFGALAAWVARRGR